MPWRLIGFICVFIVFLVFIGFNLGEEYQCDINFGFIKLENVPVFYTIFISIMLGILITLPIVLSGKKKGKDASSSSFKKKDNVPAPDSKLKPEEPSSLQNAPAAEGSNELTPSYSGGKYFNKEKIKEKKEK